MRKILTLLILFLLLLFIIQHYGTCKPDIEHRGKMILVFRPIAHVWDSRKVKAEDSFFLSDGMAGNYSYVSDVLTFNFSDGDFVEYYPPWSNFYPRIAVFRVYGKNISGVLENCSVWYMGGWFKGYFDDMLVHLAYYNSDCFTRDINEEFSGSSGYHSIGNFTIVSWNYTFSGGFSEHSYRYEVFDMPYNISVWGRINSGSGYLQLESENWEKIIIRYSVETGGGGSDILYVDVYPAKLDGSEFAYRLSNESYTRYANFPYIFNLTELGCLIRCIAHSSLGEYGVYRFVKWMLNGRDIITLDTGWINEGGILTAYYEKYAYTSILNIKAYDVSGSELNVNISYIGDFMGLNVTPFELVNKVNTSLGSSAFTVTLKALPLDGFCFVKWIVKDENNSTIITTYSDTVSITVPNDKKYVAEAYYERVEPTEVYVNAVLNNGTKLNIKVQWNITTTLSEKGYEAGEGETSFKLDFSWLRKYIEVYPGQDSWLPIKGYLIDPLMWSGEEWVYVSNSYDYAYAYLNETFIGRTTILISKVRVVGAYGRLYLLDGELNRVGEYALPSGLTEDYSLLLNLNNTRYIALGGYITYGSVMWQNVSILSVVGRDLKVGNLTLKYPTVIERNGVYYILSEVRGTNDSMLNDGVTKITVLGMHKYNITLVYSEFNATENNVLIIARLKGGELLNVLAEYTINYSIGLNITGSGLTPILIDKFNNVTVNRPISLKATEWDSVNCRVSQLGNKLRLQSYIGTGGYAWYTGLTVKGPILVRVEYTANGRSMLEPALINASDNSIIATGNPLYLSSGEAYLGFKVYGTWTVSSYKIGKVEYSDGVFIGTLTVAVPHQVSYLGITYNLSEWHGVDGYDGNKAWLSLISGNNYIIIAEYGGKSTERRSYSIEGSWYLPTQIINVSLPYSGKYYIISYKYYDNASDLVHLLVHPNAIDQAYYAGNITIYAPEPWIRKNRIITLKPYDNTTLPKVIEPEEYRGWIWLGMGTANPFAKNYTGFNYKTNTTFNIYNITLRWINETDGSIIEWNQTIVVSTLAMKIKGIYDIYGVTVVIETFFKLLPPEELNLTPQPPFGDVAIVAFDSENNILFKVPMGSGVDGYCGVNGSIVISSVYLRHDYLTFEKYWDEGTNLTVEYRWIAPLGENILFRVWDSDLLRIHLKPLIPWIIGNISFSPVQIRFRLENKPPGLVAIYIRLWNDTGSRFIGTFLSDDITLKININKNLLDDLWIYFVPSQTTNEIVYVIPVKV